jgi:hypothetical protein
MALPGRLPVYVPRTDSNVRVCVVAGAGYTNYVKASSGTECEVGALRRVSASAIS